MFDLFTEAGLLSFTDLLVNPMLLKLLVLVSELVESSTVLEVRRVEPSSLPVGMSFKLTKLPFVSILCR